MSKALKRRAAIFMLALAVFAASSAARASDIGNYPTDNDSEARALAGEYGLNLYTQYYSDHDFAAEYAAATVTKAQIGAICRMRPVEEMPIILCELEKAHVPLGEYRPGDPTQYTVGVYMPCPSEDSAAAVNLNTIASYDLDALESALIALGYEKQGRPTHFGEITGTAYSTDIMAYVNDRKIPSYNIGGKTCICVEDLAYFGFSVGYDDETRTLTAEAAEDKIYHKFDDLERGAVGEITGNTYYTDIDTYINGVYVPNSYNIGGKTCVCIEDLGRYWEGPYSAHGCSEYFMYHLWDAGARTISLYTLIPSELAWANRPV